jgi:hypothetical protein
MKNVKSLSIVKMIKNGLNKFAKVLHIKPYLLYIILGLLAVILISLGLGAQRDGFTSLNNAASTTIKAVNDMNNAINSTQWNNQTNKSNFIKNINTFYRLKMQLLNQGDTAINAFDTAGAPTYNFITNPPTAIPNLRPNGMVYKLNKEYDIPGNILPRYVDDSVTPDQTKYTLESTISNPIKQSDLDVPLTAIMEQIKFFSITDQRKLTDAFNALSKNADDMNKFMTTYFTSEYSQKMEEDIDISNLDANNILSSSFVERTDKAGTGTGTGTDLSQSDPLRDSKYSQGYGQGYGQGYKQGYGQGYVQTHSYGQDQISDFETYRLAQSNIQPGSEDLYMLKTRALPPSNPPGALYYGMNSSASDTRTSGSSASDTRASDTRASETRASETRASDTKASDTKETDKKVLNGFGSSPDLDAYNLANPGPTQSCGKPAVVPPCPPCERCPEPSFDCKRVPNYNSASTNQFLPQPMLADFSQFGM